MKSFSALLHQRTWYALTALLVVGSLFHEDVVDYSRNTYGCTARQSAVGGVRIDASGAIEPLDRDTLDVGRAARGLIQRPPTCKAERPAEDSLEQALAETSKRQADPEEMLGRTRRSNTSSLSNNKNRLRLRRGWKARRHRRPYTSPSRARRLYGGVSVIDPAEVDRCERRACDIGNPTDRQESTARPAERHRHRPADHQSLRPRSGRRRLPHEAARHESRPSRRPRLHQLPEPLGLDRSRHLGHRPALVAGARLSTGPRRCRRSRLPTPRQGREVPHRRHRLRRRRLEEPSRQVEPGRAEVGRYDDQ